MESNRCRTVSKSEMMPNLFHAFSPTIQNAIDQDQAAIEEQLARRSGSGYSNAQAVYEEGGFSKSYAVLGLTNALTVNITDGTKVTGVTAGDSGDDVTGTIYGDHSAGDQELKVVYDTSNVQERYVRCQVGALPRFQRATREGCFAETGSVTVAGVGELPYTYEQHTGNKNDRTISDFSSSAQQTMLTCPTCPYPTFDKYYKYYEAADYGDIWIRAAFNQENTNFPSGRGNAGFNFFGDDGRIGEYKSIVFFEIAEHHT